MAGNDAAETRARHEPAVCRHSPKVCGTPVGKVTLVVIILTNYSAAAYFLLASTHRHGVEWERNASDAASSTIHLC